MAHVYIKPLPAAAAAAAAAAKERFFKLLLQINKVHRLRCGTLLWVSPSKLLEIRRRNKCFGSGLSRLLRVTKLTTESDHVEIDWNSGVAWLHDRRVLALEARDLLLKTDERCADARVKVDVFEYMCRHNIAALHTITGTSLPDPEAAVHTD